MSEVMKLDGESNGSGVIVIVDGWSRAAQDDLSMVDRTTCHVLPSGFFRRHRMDNHNLRTSVLHSSQSLNT